MERAESLKVGRSLGKFAGQIARSTLWKEKILLSIIAVLWGAIVLQKFITHPPSSCAHITKSDTMQIFRSMMWLCVHGLWDSSYRFQPNTEASLTTAVTTIAVALHILKCTLCKITFSTLNGRPRCHISWSLCVRHLLLWHSRYLTDWFHHQNLWNNASETDIAT